MNMMWLLGGLGLGAGLMTLLDPSQGAARRRAVREHVGDFGLRTSGRWGAPRRSLGRQAPAVRARPHLPFPPEPGLGDWLRMQAQGGPLGLSLLGSVSLGVGLGYLLAPRQGLLRRARLREALHTYWRPAAPTVSPRPVRRRAWRIVQGQETHRVDAHTRKPAQAQAWYAEPGGYDSSVLYSPPFATRDEAIAWTHTQDAQRPPWRIVQGQETHRVEAHTRKPAQAQAWYVEPGEYDSPVLYSPPFVTRDEAIAWAHAQDAPSGG